MPSRLRRRHLSHDTLKRALHDARECRLAMVQVLAGAEINGPHYRAAQAVMAALDGFAEAATGDRTLWHAKGH